jgi:hypothetical protein
VNSVWIKPSPTSPVSAISSNAATLTSSARTWLSPMTRSRANWKRVMRNSAMRMLT